MFSTRGGVPSKTGGGSSGVFIHTNGWNMIFQPSPALRAIRLRLHKGYAETSPRPRRGIQRMRQSDSAWRIFLFSPWGKSSPPAEGCRNGGVVFLFHKLWNLKDHLPLRVLLHRRRTCIVPERNSPLGGSTSRCSEAKADGREVKKNAQTGVSFILFSFSMLLSF